MKIQNKEYRIAISDIETLRGIMATTIMNAYIKYSEDNPFENIEAVVNLTDKLINKLNQTI
jgi:hypothetical protein